MFRTKGVQVLRHFTRNGAIRSHRAVSTISGSFYGRKLAYKAGAVVAVGLAAGLGTVLGQDGPVLSDVNTLNETAESIENSVSVDKGVPAFQKFDSTPSGTEQVLLGWGVRTVTFLRMKVYALGLYVAKEDLVRIPQILDSKFMESFYDKLGGDTAALTHQEKLLLALKDPELSVILVENLINSQIRFTAHIRPLRNTDFNHLRDGLIKSIMACPKSKEILQQGDSSLPAGLDEMRKAFGTRRGSCPKGHSLFLEQKSDQSLVVTYREEKKGKFTSHILGHVKEPLVSKLLFLQYLSGAHPLSSEVRDVAVANIASVC